MKVIHANFNTETEKALTYRLTRAESVSVKDIVGAEFSVDKYMIYQDINGRGEEVEILAILTSSGEIYSTLSQTFKNEFIYIEECGLIGETLKVVSGKSKSDRTFVSVTLA